MRAFAYTEHIDLEPQAVFDFMMDFSKASRWRNLVRRIDVVTPGPLRAGSELSVSLDMQGKTTAMPSEIWAYEPPRRYGVRNTANNVTGTFEYTLQQEGVGTRVQFTCDVTPHGWMWLALPWLIRGSRVRYRDQLANLKRVIREPSAVPVDSPVPTRSS